MKIKRNLLICLAALSLINPISQVSAYNPQNFALTPRASYPSVSTNSVKKLDLESAAVTPTRGLDQVYVTFRVRTNSNQYATEYVDAHAYRTYRMNYYTGLARIGSYYRLHSSIDSGQARSYAQVRGRWEP